jgi:hypothetical protein
VAGSSGPPRQSRPNSHQDARLLIFICEGASRSCLPVDVRFSPKATEALLCNEMTRGPIPDSCTAAESNYSIISLALIKMEFGIDKPSNFAVLALMIRSWVVGSSTGMSPGLVPFRILSMKYPYRRAC